MADRRGGWLRRSLEIQAELNRPQPADESGSPQAEARQAPSRIELDCEVEGALRLDGPLLIHGDFRGSIDCRDLVTIGEAGTVQGPIRARQVVIRGSVVGNVSATRDVVLHDSARLHGDVKAPSLVVERGAYFNGRTEMQLPRPIASSVMELATAPTVRPASVGAKPTRN